WLADAGDIADLVELALDHRLVAAPLRRVVVAYNSEPRQVAKPVVHQRLPGSWAVAVVEVAHVDHHVNLFRTDQSQQIPSVLTQALVTEERHAQTHLRRDVAIRTAGPSTRSP